MAAQDSTRIPSAQPFFHALKTDGIRISQLFRVFVSLLGALKPWRVCGTNLEGDPVSQHSEHSSLRQALREASRANHLYAGIKPNFPMKVVNTHVGLNCLSANATRSRHRAGLVAS